MAQVASTGRFGSRYGVGIRRKLLKIEPLQYQKHVCPNCGAKKVKRKSKGLFECNKCSHIFAGGSYLPQTLAGTIISKMVAQKTFTAEVVGELSKASGTEEKAAPTGEPQKDGKAPNVKHRAKKEEKAEDISGPNLEEGE